MTSSPLFIMVAESIEILAPIDQTGWRRAASGVALAISSRLAVRNGPPDAVRMIFSTAARLSSASDWKIALCSESQGSSVAPASRTARSMTSPAQTSASLLARATHLPRRIAARVGARPAAPVIAAMVQSASSAAASTTASAPEATCTLRAGQGGAQRGMAGGIGDHRIFGVQGDGLLRQHPDVAAADQRPDPEAVRGVGQQLHRLGPDTAGAAQNGDGARRGCIHRHSTTPRPSINASSDAASATASSASSRSSNPPWPGISRPESFTPNWRFT